MFSLFLTTYNTIYYRRSYMLIHSYNTSCFLKLHPGGTAYCIARNIQEYLPIVVLKKIIGVLNNRTSSNTGENNTLIGGCVLDYQLCTIANASSGGVIGEE